MFFEYLFKTDVPHNEIKPIPDNIPFFSIEIGILLLGVSHVTGLT